MIRRTAASLVLAGGLVLGGGSAAAAAPKPPAPPPSLITINLPIIACVTANVPVGEPRDNPSDSCVSIPGKAGKQKKSVKEIKHG